MATRVRDITESEVIRAANDLLEIWKNLGRFKSLHHNLDRDEWLGGNQDADHHEVAPERIRVAMAKVQAAQDLLSEAEHELVMFLGEMDLEQEAGRAAWQDTVEQWGDDE